MCCTKKQAPAARAAPPVTVAQARVQNVPVYIDQIGTCTASQTVSIRPQVSGRIVTIHFSDGADVKKGDMLFTIDTAPFKAALNQAQANLGQSQAQLSLSKTLAARAAKLLPISAISQEDYESRINGVAVGEAQVKASQAAIETAEVNLNYCFIHSPIDGRVGARLVDIGNVVTANSGSSNTASTNNTTNNTANNAGTNILLTIQSMDPIYVNFTIPERDLPRVRDQMAKGIVKTLVHLPVEPLSKSRQGDLTFLDNAVQNATGTIGLRATLANTDRHFWPGQFVLVRLVLSTEPNAILIASAAVQTSQKGPFVYIVSSDLTAQLRLVELGQRHDDMIAVQKGVEAREKVITSGQLTVTPGSKVRIIEPNGPGPTQPAQTQPGIAGEQQ